MATRSYGVVSAPGQRVEETTAPRPVVAGSLGTGYLLGVFERGPVGGPGVPPVAVRSESDLLRRRGKFTVASGFYAPDCARQFLDMQPGSVLYTERVTDGTEVEASGAVLTRRCPRGVRFRKTDVLTPAAFSWTARWGGRAGGKAKLTGGTLALLGNVGTTTLTTGKAMLKDEWAGGTLVLRGVSSKTYTVLSNTVGGVLTVASDQDMAADIAADDPTTLEWAVEVVNLENDGRRRAVALEVLPRGGRRPTTEFGVRIKLDRDVVAEYPDLTMVAAAGKKELEATVNQATDNYEADVDNVWTGADAADVRPANWSGVVAEGGVAASTLTLWIIEWTSTGTQRVFVDPRYFNYGSDLRPGTLTLTFTGPAAYTVDSDLVDDIPAAVALGANNLHLLHPYLFGFTLSHIGMLAPQAGDTVTIRVKALPTDGSLAGALLWPDADGSNAAVSIPVLSNTSRTVTVPSFYDLTSYVTAPGHAYVETVAAGPWNTAGPVPSYGPAGDLTGITCDGDAVAAFDFPISAALTAAALKAAWEAHDTRLWAEVQSSGKLRMGVRSTGPLATFGYTGGVAAGDILPAAPQAAVGTAGSLVVLQWPQEGRSGYDGDAPTDGRFVSALQPTGSIKEILTQNIGQPLILVPGVTGPTVQAAGRALAASLAGMFVPDIPTSVLTEAAAVAYQAATLGLSDFHAPFWPSWGYVDEADLQETDRLVPLSGYVCGLMARSYNQSGMGKAPAGLAMELVGVKKLLKANDEVLPDAELLNPVGIRTITKRGGASFVVWGARIPGDTQVWLHKRGLMNQLIRELLYPGNWDQFIFEVNDPVLWGQLASALRSLFQLHYTAGWFNRRLAFEQAVQIKVDSDVNDAAAQAAGRLVAAVSYYSPETTEQVVFRLSEAGITE